MLTTQEANYFSSLWPYSSLRDEMQCETSRLVNQCLRLPRWGGVRCGACTRWEEGRRPLISSSERCSAGRWFGICSLGCEWLGVPVLCVSAAVKMRIALKNSVPWGHCLRRSYCVAHSAEVLQQWNLVLFLVWMKLPSKLGSIILSKWLRVLL